MYAGSKFSCHYYQNDLISNHFSSTAVRRRHTEDNVY